MLPPNWQNTSLPGSVWKFGPYHIWMMSVNGDGSCARTLIYNNGSVVSKEAYIVIIHATIKGLLYELGSSDREYIGQFEELFDPESVLAELGSCSLTAKTAGSNPAIVGKMPTRDAMRRKMLIDQLSEESDI